MTEYQQSPRRKWEDLALAVAVLLALAVVIGAMQ